MNLVAVDSPWLIEQAQEIKDLECSLERRTHEVRKRQGEILLAVKERLEHGSFTKWLKTLGWSDRTARHYIQQYKGVDKPKQIEAAKPQLDLIEAEVVEIEDGDLTESAHSKSARFAVLDAQSFLGQDLKSATSEHLAAELKEHFYDIQLRAGAENLPNTTASYQTALVWIERDPKFVWSLLDKGTLSWLSSLGDREAKQADRIELIFKELLLKAESTKPGNSHELIDDEPLPIIEAILDSPTNTPEGFTEYDDYPDGEALPVIEAIQERDVDKLVIVELSTLEILIKSALSDRTISRDTAKALREGHLPDLTIVPNDVLDCYKTLGRVATLYKDIFVKASNAKDEYIKAFVDATDKYWELHHDSD